MGNNIKARHWAMVVYPESAPENWLELLEQTYLQFAVSPLHDKDVDPDGQIKKAHWHVILSWDGPQRATAAQKIAEMVNAPKPIRIESVRGAYRYFTHMDNPDKYQYDSKEIRVFNGFDISSYIALTKEERYEAITAIISYINENKVTEYLDLLNELMTHDYSLFKVACDNTILFTALIRSNRHKSDR
ncbi:plasmid replication protein [Staphylococcus pseudintermedius]|nr:plasmid replication protein [Staphylococcus pseudintermedius]